MNYRVLLGDDSVSQLYGGVESLPTTFLIDRKGRVAFPPHIGLAGKNEYLKEIQSLLGEQQQTTSLVSAPLPLAALRFGPAK
jgi:cytochrome c biogenesis protein CcmG/thiol:disulfide interchange protein DsbE